MALLFAAMIEMGIFESLLTQVLKVLGFHPLGPKKGTFIYDGITEHFLTCL